MTISATIIKRCLLVLGMTLASTSAMAHDAIVLSKGFQVCIRGIAGLTFEPKQGIDAVEGQIAGNGGIIEFMVSRHPNLPAAMNIKPDKTSVISRQLTSDLQLIAVSTGPLQMGVAGRPIVHGMERLYALNKGTVATPVGPIQDQVFVQLWSDGHRQNDRLVKTVGDGLCHCQ